MYFGRNSFIVNVMTKEGNLVKKEILLRRPIESLLDLLGRVPFLEIKQELSDVRGAR